MSFLWAACVIGLAGSVHCILMCGPLASGMISASSNGSRLMLRTMLYQTGRITSYLLIGMLFGALGKLVSLLFYQQLLSVVSGVLLLLWVVIMALQRSSSSGRLLKLWSRATSKLFAILRSKKTTVSVFGLGMLNGFLPCGMVYLAATASLNHGSIGYSLLFMLLFGLGTLPSMTGVILTRNLVPIAWKSSLRRLAPVFISVMGLLFVLRGLDLNIPYVSPHIVQSSHGKVHSCCTKPEVVFTNQ